MKLEALDGTDKIEVNRLWTVDKLNASSCSIPSEQDARKWPHLSDIKLPNIDERQVKLIIGTNTPEAFWVLEERRNRGEPYAICSPLGWTMMGPTDRVESKECYHSVNFIRFAEVEKEDDDCLMQQLEQFWQMENCEAIPDSKVSRSVEDKKALAIMENSLKIIDGHYQVALPWKEQPPHLPSNWFMAERRLHGLKKRFLQDSALFESYKTTMEGYLERRHASRVPDDELDVNGMPLWYLPHHPVFNKPGKTRVVFDCAAKCKGTSLSDQLLSGPDFTNSIVSVLTRFREESVALA